MYDSADKISCYGNEANSTFTLKSDERENV
jgi:hypothetical protein